MSSFEKPLKFKLYLTPEQLEAYRTVADLLGKKSIADYVVHAIHTYTTFVVNELRTQEAGQSKEQGSDHVQVNS